MDTNVLYYGDNLTWLRNHDCFPNDSVDLVYLDPPYNSNTNYNLIFNRKPEFGYEESPSQIRAFGDTWKWETGTASDTLSELEQTNAPVFLFLESLRKSGVINLSTVSYLIMMSTRLIELHRVLNQNGSLWLHCDPTASHYLKILLDIIFHDGKIQGELQNEIVWAYEGGGASGNRFGRKHDVLFWYTKSKKVTHSTLTRCVFHIRHQILGLKHTTLKQTKSVDQYSKRDLRMYPTLKAKFLLMFGLI